MRGRRRMPTLLAAAAALATSAEAASVRGSGGGGRSNIDNSNAGDRRRRPRRGGRPARDQDVEQTQRQRQSYAGGRPGQRRALKGARPNDGRDDGGRGLELGSTGKTRTGPQGKKNPSAPGEGRAEGGKGTHWWHDNASDEKDVVYHLLGGGMQPMSGGGGGDGGSGGGGSPPPDALDDGTIAYHPLGYNQNGMQPYASAGGPGSNGQFVVYSINVDNGPDTSHLIHNQPTKTPTPQPTRAPTPNPTEDVDANGSSGSATTDGDGGETSPPWKHLAWYPLWYDAFQGCASSVDPPDMYRDISEVTYLFDTKAECCMAWFDYPAEEGGGGGGGGSGECMGRVYDGMVLQSAAVGSDVMEPYNGGGVTGASDDGGAGPPPGPPTPPSPTPPASDPPPPPPTPPPVATPPPVPSPTPPVGTPDPTDGTPATPHPTDGAPVATPPPTGSAPQAPAPTAWPTWTPYNDDPFLPPLPGPAPATTAAPPNPGSTMATTTAAPPTPLDLPGPGAPGTQTTAPSTAAAGGSSPTYEPTSPWPTFSPVAVVPALDDSQGDAMTANSEAASSFHPPVDHTASATPILYQESFEDENLPVGGYFAWGARGNGQWEIAPVPSAESYDGGGKVATIDGAGDFAIEGTLVLTIGGGDGYDVDAAAVQAMRERGAYVTFGLQTRVGFPSDFLILRVGATMMGYWNHPVEDWTTVRAYLPPLDGASGGTEEVTWAYNYYPSLGDDGGEGEGPAVMLDGLVVEATTGDLEVTDADLHDASVYGNGLPALDLHHSSGEAGWSVNAAADAAFDGSYVLGASTRDVIRAANPDGTMTTYHGTAVASFTVITGPWGGKVHFRANAHVNTPIDVLEVGVDGVKIMAWVHPTNGWEEYVVDLDYPGKHVVTFVHVSNPTNKGMAELEGFGTPGSSRIGGIRYTDNVDPSTLTNPPTASPTGAPTGTPTPWTIPRQNYCGASLSSIADTCYTDDAVTCNHGEGCPVGTWCYSAVDCHVPEAFLASLHGEATPNTTPATVAAAVGGEPPRQNYCGTNLADIRATCASGSVPTCNDDDPGCPEGTYCWGAVECDGATPEAPASEAKAGPTPSPTGESIESFLDSFFGVADSEPEPEPPQQQEEIVSFSTSTEDAGCPEDLHAVDGMPGCCVPDPTFLGDGACDAYEESPYNTEACFWDRGDCCRETCDKDTAFGCAAREGDEFGPFGFYCLDPRYSNIDDEACDAANKEWIGDGGCDPEYNTQACGWDGGDCCRQTCDPEYAYYKCGREEQPFECKDPDVIYRADYVP